LEDFRSLLPQASVIFTSYSREAVVLQIDREKPSELSVTGLRVAPKEDIFHGLDKVALKLISGAEQRVREYRRKIWVVTQNIILSLSFINLSEFYSGFKEFGLSKFVEIWSDVSEGSPIQM